MGPSRWTYNPDTRTVTITQNGEFNLQIGEANWVLIKVEVDSGSKNVSEDVPGETL